jgi:hypothetical protein
VASKIRVRGFQNRGVIFLRCGGLFTAFRDIFLLGGGAGFPGELGSFGPGAVTRLGKFLSQNLKRSHLFATRSSTSQFARHSRLNSYCTWSKICVQR